MVIDLQGKKGVILGVANQRSIAWAITKAFSEAGATIVLNYQAERVREGVEKLAGQLDPKPLILPCDLCDDAQIDAFFNKVSEVFDGKLDFVVHSVAYASKEDLEGRLIDTSRAGFALTMEVSAYTLVAVAQRAEPMLRAAGGGSIMTMSYLGAERAVENYNVMGVAKAALESAVRYLAVDLGDAAIRVNAISAGPIRTLAARGISGLNELLKVVEARSPMRRNVHVEEVGSTAVFLASDASSGITGETMYVDCGFNIRGV
jgi:enoyl-[acyl-carrier protein] reductase I